MKIFWFLLFFLVALSLLDCASLARERSRESLSTLEEELLTQINEWRRSQGKGMLQLDCVLTIIAQNYSEDMKERHYFSHVDPEGEMLQDRLVAAGIRTPKSGENLAQIKGNFCPEEVLDAWLKSLSHRKNLEEDSFTKTGLSIALDKDGVYYVTQIFFP